jgi:hypothetical protein
LGTLGILGIENRKLYLFTSRQQLPKFNFFKWSRPHGRAYVCMVASARTRLCSRGRALFYPM